MPHPTSADAHPNLGDSDGLVRLASDHEVPEDAARAMQTTRWEQRLLAVFLLVTLAAGIVDTLLPIAIPPLAGQEQARRETQRQALRWQDGSWARWVEENRRLRSRVRHHLLPPYALLLYQTFGEVHGDLLHGRNGWLFLRQRVQPRPEDDDVILRQAAETLAQVQAWTKARDHRLVVIPLPRKASLAHRYVPPGIDPRPQLDRRLPEVLTAHGVEHVDILPRLDALESTWGETPYFRGDSHLGQSAMHEAAEAVAEHLGLSVESSRRRSTLQRLGRQPAEYDLLRFVGIRLTPWTRRLASVERRHQLQVLGPNGQPLEMPKNTKAELQVALVGTSFSTVSQWANLLAHAMDTPVLDAAEAGENPFAVLHRRLQHASSPNSLDRIPTTILFEVPDYVLFDEQGLAAVQAMLGEDKPF